MAIINQFNIDEAETLACLLLSEDGENPEYDRAIAELLCELRGRQLCYAAEILEDLRKRRIRFFGRK